MNRPCRLTKIGAAFVVVLCFGVLALGQIDRQRPSNQPQNDRTATGSIKGRIVMPSGAFSAETIKVTLSTLRETITTVYTDNQGQFEIRNLNPGNYQIEVEANRQKFDLKTDTVQVFKGTPTVVTLTLNEKNDGVNNANSSVSLSELDSNIPSNARKEFDKASKLASNRDSQEAIVHLRKAIELYPRFVMAYNDLGAQLLAQGKLQEAAEVLTKAVALDNKAFNPALNLGIVLVYQHRFSEAADILNTATSLEPNSPSARLYSGLAAMGLGNFEAAEKELKTAHSLGGTPYAIALYHLGELYVDRGEKELALNSLELYLREVPNAVNSEQVRKTIAMLR